MINLGPLERTVNEFLLLRGPASRALVKLGVVFRVQKLGMRQRQKLGMRQRKMTRKSCGVQFAPNLELELRDSTYELLFTDWAGPVDVV